MSDANRRTMVKSAIAGGVSVVFGTAASPWTRAQEGMPKPASGQTYIDVL
jgi:hypothetical protein